MKRPSAAAVRRQLTLERIREPLKVGDTVYFLFAKADGERSRDQLSGTAETVLIMPRGRSMTWGKGSVSYMDGDKIEVMVGVRADGSDIMEWFERRFLCTYAQAISLKLPRVPA